VGDALAEHGARIAVNGGADEKALCAQVCAAMRAPALDLSGRLSLRGLLALLARSRLVVSNDTGPLHLAQAVGTPTLGFYWFMNLLASAPLVAGPHRELFSTRIQCPVCGAENVRERCTHDASFVADVPLEEARALALQMFSDAAPAASAPR
jgi:ADP-heptose:LPS heptosyltransferase